MWFERTRLGGIGGGGGGRGVGTVEGARVNAYLRTSDPWSPRPSTGGPHARRSDRPRGLARRRKRQVIDFKSPFKSASSALRSVSAISKSGYGRLLAAPRDALSRARPPRPDRAMSSKFGDAPARGGRGRKRKLQQQAHRPAPANKTSVALPASAVYTQLVDFERRVDATLARKKAEVNEALRRVERVPRVVRLYVYNTFKPATETSVTLPPADDRAASGAGASSTARVETDVEPASWTLHVHGRLLPADAPPGDADRDLEGEPKFDAFVRRLEVRLDPALYPDPSEPGGGVVARWNADDAPRDAPPSTRSR